MTGRRPFLHALASALFACIRRPTPANAQTPFYLASPGEIAGPPGSIIRAESMVGAPSRAATYRVLYRSTGLHGEPIAVSGVVIVPPGPAPAGGRPVIAWAHPTTGVVPRCAPSLSPFLFPLIPGLRDMIARGYVIAATDYPGLGTPGPHPYLVGLSEGRAVLDSVRAARALPEAGASEPLCGLGPFAGRPRRALCRHIGAALCAGAESRRRGRRSAGDRARHAVQG